MNSNVYFDIYNYLVIDKRIDTDEAECILSDIEDTLKADLELDPWELVEELV